MKTNANRLIFFILLLGILASAAMFVAAFESIAAAQAIPYIAYGLMFLAVTLGLCGIVEYCYTIATHIENKNNSQDETE